MFKCCQLSSVIYYNSKFTKLKRQHQFLTFLLFNMFFFRYVQIAAQMANPMRKSTIIENRKSHYFVTALKQGFEELDKEMWLDLSEMLSEEKYGMNELTRLEVLANLIKVGSLESYHNVRRFNW